MSETATKHTGMSGKPLSNYELWVKFKPGSKLKEYTYPGDKTLVRYQGMGYKNINSELDALFLKIGNCMPRIKEAFLFDNTGPVKRLQVAHWENGELKDNLLGL